GGRETIMGFKALGLDAFPVMGDEETLSTFKRLTRENENYAIIYVEETYAKVLSAEIDKYKDNPTPAIILIPGREGSLGLGQSALQAAVQRAAGSDIL
ncbi:MAG: V-type ATP synthase subunit F, partial [Clostridia bacterium]|nr:V-type ATP synthase subunit F [Clostridia bacterium]